MSLLQVPIAMGRDRDPFRIPRAGWEIAPLAGLASVDLNGSGLPGGGGEFVTESTAGGIAVYAVYQALLTAMRTEAMRRRGEIDRTTQLQTIAATVWESGKQGAVVSAALGMVLLVCPWLTLPLSLVGAVGLGKASLDLFHAFWDGLSAEQQAQLRESAFDAGVNLRRFLEGPEPAVGGQVG